MEKKVKIYYVSNKIECKKILKAMKDNNITMSQLSEYFQMSQSYLYAMLIGRRDIPLDIARQLQSLLDLKIIDE